MDFLNQLRLKLRDWQVPEWTAADHLAHTKGWSVRFLGSGTFGRSYLYSNGPQTLVLKIMRPGQHMSFSQEVRALAKVRGIEGLQQVVAVILKKEHPMIVSHYAGATLEACVKKRLLSHDQLEAVLE